MKKCFFTGRRKEIKERYRKAIEFIFGLLVFSVIGTGIGYVIYREIIPSIAVGLVIGIIGIKEYRNHIFIKRKSNFEKEFCDYLDAISSSLSCGRNSYDAFVFASLEMERLYRKDALICKESRRLSNGLQNGRLLKDLLNEMANRVDSENVHTFSEVYSICISSGGNLKTIVNETKTLINEKIAIERELKTIIAGTKNEFTIMMFMPLVITCSLRVFDMGFGTASSFWANTIAVIIFLFAYVIGSKIIRIEV